MRHEPQERVDDQHCSLVVIFTQLLWRHSCRRDQTWPPSVSNHSAAPETQTKYNSVVTSSAKNDIKQIKSHDYSWEINMIKYSWNFLIYQKVFLPVKNKHFQEITSPVIYRFFSLKTANDRTFLWQKEKNLPFMKLSKV